MQESSWHSFTRRTKQYPRLGDLERFVARVKQDAPVAAILFGSLARGDYTQYSDIDVLCVFDREFKDPRERFMTAYKHSDGVVQPVTVSLHEFKTGLLNGDPFLHEVVRDGVLVHGTIPASVINSWMAEGASNITTIPFFS